MKFIFLTPIFGAFISASGARSDPVGIFTSLGVGGVIAMVVWLWQRDTGKQRDRLQAWAEQLTPILGEVRDALRASNETHKANAETARVVMDLLSHFPPEEVWTRIRIALEQAERGRGG